MELIGQFDSPFVRRVAIALHHYGFSFDHKPWSVWAQADQVAKHNPLRRVPVLVLDGGETLIESSAILDALDDMAPADRRLIAPGGPGRRRVLRLCALATGLADKAVSLLYERVLRIENRRNALWIERCEAQIHDTLAVLESERASGAVPFWLGSLSHADIALACALRFTREAHPKLFASQTVPHLLAHSERAEASALFQRAVQPLHVAVDSSRDG